MPPAGVNWADLGAWVAVLAPLVGVPLTAITFYLRALRDQATGRLADLGRRVDRLDEAAAELARRLDEVQRDFTTKEEWVRESMLARSERQWLTRTVARMQSSDGGKKATGQPGNKPSRQQGNGAARKQGKGATRRQGNEPGTLNPAL